MIKRITIVFNIVIIAVGGAVFFISSSDDDKHADQQSRKLSSGNEKKEAPEADPSLDSIFDFATQGKVPGVNIVVGETTADDVQEAWGNPEETADTNVGRFLNYPSHGIDVGITDNIVSDMRSSQNKFTAFDMDTIKSYKKPDETRYYQDDKNDQIILVYELSHGYVLKWVLPNPAGDSDNPDVGHISLSKGVNGDGVNGENSDASGDRGNESMNLDEKIGQMIFSGVDGTGITAESKKTIKNYHVGGIILFGNNIVSKTQTVNFLNGIKTANAGNSYPLFLGVDEEGGSVTRMPDEIKSLPTNRSIGELNDPDLSFNVGTVLGSSRY